MRVLILITFFWGLKTYSQGKWIPMLDKKLSKWDTYLSYTIKKGYDGSQPIDKDGNYIEAIGLNTPEQEVFTVISEKGESILKVSGEIYGCLVSKKEYQNYHLKLKVKWGLTKHEPRKEKLKDTGIMYHSIGALGTDYFRTWMLSQEFQIMEGHMGDYWSQQTSAIDIKAIPSEGRKNAVADYHKSFLAFGKGAKNSYCMRSTNNEKENNDWNTLELICFNGKSLHIVNKKVVMVLQNSRNVTPNGVEPLVKGKIQIQSEAAEVFFKNLKIKELKQLPLIFQKYF